MSIVHLCIDMQVWCGQQDGAWKPKYTAEEWAMLKGHVQKLLNELKQRNITTIWIGQTGTEGTFLGTLEELQAKYKSHNTDFVQSDNMFDFDIPLNAMVGIKSESSAYSIPELRTYIEENNIKVIILSGWSEGYGKYHDGCCVSQTAIDLAKPLKYGVVIAADATNAALPCYWPEDLHSQLPLVSIEYRKRDFARFNVHIDPMDEIIRRIDAATANKEKPTPPVKATPGLTLKTKDFT